MPSTRSTAKFCPTCKQPLAANYSLNVSRETCEFLSDVTPAMLIFTATVGSFVSGILTNQFGDFAEYVFMALCLYATFTLSTATVSSFSKCHRKMQSHGWKRPIQRLFLLLSCGLLSIAMFVTTLPAWKMFIESRRSQSSPSESIAQKTPPARA